MPKNSNILLVRHAEKPNDQNDKGLTPLGQARAMAYVVYFQNLQVKSHPIKLTHLFATAESAHSNRSFLTIQPLSQSLNLKINQNFSNDDKDIAALINAIQTDPQFNDSDALICWHHETLLKIAEGLGAAKSALPTDWPDDVYGWLIELTYDATGNLTDTLMIEQKLMYDDHDQPVH